MNPLVPQREFRQHPRITNADSCTEWRISENDVKEVNPRFLLHRFPVLSIERIEVEDGGAPSRSELQER